MKPKAIATDFDNTVFKRYLGLISPVVEYIKAKGLPVLVFSYRAENQQDFILDTLRPSGLNVAVLCLADSRSKDPGTKQVMIQHYLSRYDIVEGVDDDYRVLQVYDSYGIRAVHPSQIVDTTTRLALD